MCRENLKQFVQRCSFAAGVAQVLFQQSLIRFVIESAAASVGAPGTELGIQAAGKKQTPAHSPADGFHRARLDERGDAFLHRSGQRLVAPQSVEGEKIVGRKTADALFTKPFEEANECRILNVPREGEPDFMRRRTRKTGQRFAVPDSAFHHEIHALAGTLDQAAFGESLGPIGGCADFADPEYSPA